MISGYSKNWLKPYILMISNYKHPQNKCIKILEAIIKKTVRYVYLAKIK